jgi:hypothetical protein
MVLVSFCIDLAGQQLIEEVGVGSFFFRRLFQLGGKLLFDLVEPQLMAVFAQAVELRGAHRSAPPSLWLMIS